MGRFGGGDGILNRTGGGGGLKRSANVGLVSIGLVWVIAMYERPSIAQRPCLHCTGWKRRHTVLLMLLLLLCGLVECHAARRNCASGHL